MTNGGVDVSEKIRGILPVLQTPVALNGDLDVASMERQVAYCIEAGAHGLVFPVLGSEFQYLSDRERQQLVEIVVGEAGGQIPVVVGVAGASTAIAVEHTRHAASARADAVIALPPTIAPASQEETLAYYEAISQAGGLPIFVQNSPPGLAVPFLLRLLREIENVRYVKEEAHPSAHHIAALVAAGGEDCLGVLGGAWGRWMLSEMRRGAGGFMPGAPVVDVHVQIWDAFQEGDETTARQIFNQLLPLTNLTLILGMPLVKEVLVRRGVIQTTGMRIPGGVTLDEEDLRELDIILADLQPLFRV